MENILAAALAARLAGVSPAAIASVIREFKGVEHRLEFLRELDGVVYYNDSKATTPEETIAGLRALSVPVVLIAGGYDKKLPFTELAKVAAERCRVVILIGATAGKIREALEEVEEDRLLSEIHQAASLEEAVAIARSKAGPGKRYCFHRLAPVMICSAILKNGDGALRNWSLVYNREKVRMGGAPVVDCSIYCA